MLLVLSFKNPHLGKSAFRHNSQGSQLSW